MCKPPSNYVELQAAYVYLHNENKRLNEEAKLKDHRINQLNSFLTKSDEALTNTVLLTEKRLSYLRDDIRFFKALLIASWIIQIIGSLSVKLLH